MFQPRIMLKKIDVLKNPNLKKGKQARYNENSIAKINQKLNHMRQLLIIHENLARVFGIRNKDWTSHLNK